MRLPKTALLVLMVLVVLVTSCAPATPAAAPGPTAVARKKVALIIANRSDDMGWGTQSYLGITKAASKYGVDFQVSEEVTLANVEAIINDYAARGTNVIIAHGSQFSDAMSVVAPKYPKLTFVATSSPIKVGGNVSNYVIKVWELGYLTGVLAAKMSKTGKIGGVVGMDTPTAVAQFEGYKLGAKATNPNIQVTVQYIGSWGDVAKGREAALAMIASGADVLAHNASLGGTGMMKAAEEKGVMSIGFPLDQNALSSSVIASALQKYDEVIQQVVGAYMDGTLKPELYAPSIAENTIGFTYTAKVPKDVQDYVAQVGKDIASGKITVPQITKATP